MDEHSQSDPGPLGGLPPADPTLLASAPLEAAIIEVRFTPSVSNVSSDSALRIRDAVQAGTGKQFPRVEEAVQQQMQIDFGPGGAAQMRVQANGWQFVSADGKGQITLMPTSLIFQTSDYERWSISMKAPLSVLLTQVSEHLAPSLVQRVGLRYIDKFDDQTCTTAQDWVGKIDRALLGPVNHPILGGRVRAAQQQIEIALDDDHGALLRHGPIVDGDTGHASGYLLDIDVFNGTSAAFEPEQLLETAERLNRTALALFQSGVTPDYLRSLQQGEGNS